MLPALVTEQMPEVAASEPISSTNAKGLTTSPSSLGKNNAGNPEARTMPDKSMTFVSQKCGMSTHIAGMSRMFSGAIPQIQAKGSVPGRANLNTRLILSAHDVTA